jgi:hypothetical protein
MVWQHDTTRSNSNGFGASSDVANQDRSSRAGVASHIMMFCYPIAGITQSLGMLGNIQGVAQGICSGKSLWDWRYI